MTDSELDCIKRIGELKRERAELLKVLEDAADYIKDLDGGDQHSETGWKSEELLGVWLNARAAISKAERRP